MRARGAVLSERSPRNGIGGLPDAFERNGGWSEDDCKAHRVIVCGSRKWRDREAIADRLFDLPPSTIVHGNAAGADRIAAQEAQKLGHLVESHPAEWDRFGKAAGPMRNQKMADLGASLCIAFWDGQSTGTADMVRRATYKGIPVDRRIPTGDGGTG